MARARQAGGGALWLVGVIWLAAVLSLVYEAVILILLNQGMVAGSGWALSVQIVGGACLVFLVLGVALSSMLMLGHFRQRAADGAALVSDLHKLLSGQTQTEAILTQISENLLLSDAIKGVAFRDKDRTVLQEAIEEDMRRERWDSAAVLIDELADRFGCKQEADALRLEMERYRRATIEEKIDATIKHIESLWLIHRYEEAEREVESLGRLYPQSPKVQNLRGQTEARRQGHKAELLARWDSAVKNNDVEQGVELLKLLDNYLTATEAAALEESARGVFRAKLHNMGVQFSLFVTQREWSKALKLGREIMEEFPNSRMAEEVREKLDILEQRASG